MCLRLQVTVLHLTKERQTFHPAPSLPCASSWAKGQSEIIGIGQEKVIHSDWMPNAFTTLVAFKSWLSTKLKEDPITLAVVRSSKVIFNNRALWFLDKALREFRVYRDSSLPKLLPFTSIYVNKIFQCLNLKKKKDKGNEIKLLLTNPSHSSSKWYSHEPIVVAGGDCFVHLSKACIFNKIWCLITYQNF